MTRPVRIKDFSIGGDQRFALISGPCVIEDNDTPYRIASYLKQLTDKLDIPYIFKASYDKANRTSIHSFRGPGLTEGLKILSQIRKDIDVPVLSDIHQISEVEPASGVLDVIQIPAFLCRQTDLLVEAAKSGKPINIKKGQFLSPWDMANVVEKVRHAVNNQILITERGAMFGYNNLVSDFRSIRIMQETGCPVIFDATHSVQLPGGAGSSSGGQRDFAPLLAKAAIAVGANAVFMEVHPDPDKALSDGPNALRLDDVEGLLVQLKNIHQAVQ